MQSSKVLLRFLLTVSVRKRIKNIFFHLRVFHKSVQDQSSKGSNSNIGKTRCPHCPYFLLKRMVHHLRIDLKYLKDIAVHLK